MLKIGYDTQNMSLTTGFITVTSRGDTGDQDSWSRVHRSFLATCIADRLQADSLLWVVSPAYKRERLALARQALQVPTPSPLTLEAEEVLMQQVAQKEISRCPCNELGRLRIIAKLPLDRFVVVLPHPSLFPRPSYRSPS